MKLGVWMISRSVHEKAGLHYVCCTFVPTLMERMSPWTPHAVQEKKKRCPVRPSANSANAGHKIVWRIVPFRSTTATPTATATEASSDEHWLLVLSDRGDADRVAELVLRSLCIMPIQHVCKLYNKFYTLSFTFF